MQANSLIFFAEVAGDNHRCVVHYSPSTGYKAQVPPPSRPAKLLRISTVVIMKSAGLLLPSDNESESGDNSLILRTIGVMKLKVFR